MTDHKIIAVIAKDFTLHCTFDDGTKKTYDMRWIQTATGSMATALQANRFFAQAFVDGGSVAWPNGFDVCANLIYSDGLTSQPSRSQRKPATTSQTVQRRRVRVRTNATTARALRNPS